MRLVRHGFVGVACLALAAAAYAQSTAVAVPDNAPVQTAPLDTTPATWGDAKAGQTKAGACAACHGLDGNAMQRSDYVLSGECSCLAHRLHRAIQQEGGVRKFASAFAGIDKQRADAAIHVDQVVGARGAVSLWREMVGATCGTCQQLHGRMRAMAKPAGECAASP